MPTGPQGALLAGHFHGQSEAQPAARHCPQTLEQKGDKCDQERRDQQEAESGPEKETERDFQTVGGPRH